MNSPPLNYQLLRLSALLQLEQRARAATRAELKFLIVNDTATVVSYQQAVLWQSDAAGAGSFTLSGVAVADDGGPYRIWLDQVIAAITRGADANRLHIVTARELGGVPNAEWEEWFPPQALWCPLVRGDGKLLGGMLFGRADPWGDGDQQLIETLGGGYAQCLVLADQVFRRRLGPAALRRPKVLIGIALAVLLLALLPVRESVLAPAEIAAANPAPVRSPFEGVVYALHVAPNDPVHAGQQLVSLDKTELQTKLAVTQKALDMAAEEYAGTSQEAMDDPKAKSRLAILQSKVDQQKAELAYDREMLDRADVTAPADGIAVFDDSNEWAGKPVALGERIMLVASPTDTELEIQVPASEVVTFEPGSKVAFFSNLAPDRPARGKLVFASYSSSVTAEGVLSYAFRAKLDPGEPALRLGLKGTAKIYGPRRSLILWVLRRPIAAIRKTLSL
jgi:multidrug resistance efflux pump